MWTFRKEPQWKADRGMAVILAIVGVLSIYCWITAPYARLTAPGYGTAIHLVLLQGITFVFAAVFFYFRFLRKYRRIGCCDGCSRHHSEIAALVEGIAAGRAAALICPECIASLADKLAADKLVASTEDADASQVQRSLDPNPYSPPYTQLETRMCDFCGTGNETPATFGEKDQFAICASCLLYSQDLLRAKMS